MGFKLWMILLLLSLATVAESSSSPSFFTYINHGEVSVSVGEHIGLDGEMMMDSDINRRQLAAAKRFISYGALKKDSVPCNRRGQSYYNCTKMRKANPYKRGCSAITRCKRFTG